MRITYSDCYGFCKGVRSAVAAAEDALCKANKLSIPCYAAGDIVHSACVMDSLKEKGLQIVAPEAINAPGIAVIRAHGVPDSVRSSLEAKGLEIVDATCPVVLRSQKLLRESKKETIVIGNAGHSEVDALLGAGRNTILVERESDLEKLDSSRSYNAVVQTTFSLPLLESIKAKAIVLGLDIAYLNTICQASIERRKALEALLPAVDALVVCGDSASKNTRELVEMGRMAGKPSFLVSSPLDIPSDIFLFDTIGLTAGASCPDTLIESIERRLSDV